MPQENRDSKALMTEALLRLKEARGRIEELEREKHGEVAIVGIGCRFPGPGGRDLHGLDAIWSLLSEGREAIGEIPPERWDVEHFYDPDYDVPGRIVSRLGGFLEDPTLFDPQFFGISPREALTMDPQQRLLLETCWEALEHACMSPLDLRGSRTGVFVGIATADYSLELCRNFSYEEIVALAGTGTDHSVAAGRISYTLGLTGPCLAVNTACSSSLVALQLAIESLRRGECDLALVTGVNVMLSPMTSMVFSNSRMLSRDGRCKTFDESADGYGRGEGVGVLVLKRREDAERDHDRIHACVLGAAMNQDGASGGITVPNGPSQESVVRAALANARVQPGEVSYIEAHGTGTALGDPIEMGALAAVFASEHAAEQPLFVGSIKTNLGHTEAAAGIAGLIKLVLQMRHRELAPHLHFERPTKHIPWDRLPFTVPRERTPWTVDGRRIAGLSSFGFSGTNAHVVVGEAPATEREPRAEADEERVLPLSARTPEALAALADAWVERLGALADDELDAACATAARGRSHFAHRLAAVGRTRAELSAALTGWRNGTSGGVLTGEVHERLSPQTLALPATASELASAYVEGLRIDWSAVVSNRAWERIDVPTYPFERARFFALPFRRYGEESDERLAFTSLAWMPKPAPARDDATGAAWSGRWAVLGGGSLASELEQALGARGVDSVRADAVHELAGDESTVVLVAAEGDGDDQDAEAQAGCAAVLDAVQRLAGRTRPPRLRVVSRDTVAGAATLALARVASLEHPELSIERVLVASGSGDDLARALAADDGEDEVRLDGGERSAARLGETPPADARELTTGGAWLVTGGLGALGTRVAALLLARGAERIVLAGRSAAPDKRPAELIDERVDAIACDVSDAAACSALVESIGDLRGVVHTAGVLDDGVLAELTPERLARVLQPKLAGAWNLHRATRGMETLEHFVLFSSSAAVLGSPGQANYVAANAGLEALAEARARAGLPALAIHFGPWAEAGMAADGEALRRLASLGMRALAPERCLAALETLMTSDYASAGFFSLDWRLFARALPPGAEPRRLQAFLAAFATQAREGEPELLAQLQSAAPDARRAGLGDYLARTLGRVLRMPAESVDRRRPLAELGLDSLMGVELRNRVQADLGVTAPMTAVLGADSLEAFAGTVHGLLDDTGAFGDPERELADADELLADIEGLSDEEVERLLAQGDDG
ncbi:MAG: SDR family NAD(P)-dependent oxidoreductase [Planctomycetota bacterium]